MDKIAANMFSRVLIVSSVVLILLSNSGNAQQELTSFQEILDFASNEVGLLTVVVNSAECESDSDAGNLNVVYQFDSWLSYDHGNGTLRFRTTKNFITGGERAFHIVQSFNNDITEVYSRHYTPDMEFVSEKIFYCAIGQSARFYAYGGGRPTVALVEYVDLKAALLEGKNVNVKALVSDCDDYSLVYEGITNSKWVDDWEITNEGSDDEVIWIFWDVWIDHHLDAAPAGVERIIAGIRPDGSVQYVPMIFDLISWNEGFQLGDGFTCQLGATFLAFAPEQPAAQLAVYTSYEDLLEGLETDHAIEVVVEAAKCEWDSEPGPYEPTIFSQTFPVWTVHRAEERTFVSFFNYMTGPTGNGTGMLLQQQYAVESDDTVTVALHRLDPVDRTVLQRDVATCELGTAAVFRSESRERRVLHSFDALVEALGQGRRVSWYADLAACTGFLGNVTVEAGGSFPSGTSFDAVLNNGVFFAPVTQLANPDEAGETFGWVAMTVNWLAESDSFILLFSEYDFVTWEDNLEGQGVATCQIGYPDVYLYW